MRPEEITEADRLSPGAEAQVRRIVREEIQAALRAIDLAAEDLDMPYETSELDSRAYQADRQVAQHALANLEKCWADGHVFADSWGRASEHCRRCGEPEPVPANPFEEDGRG